MSESQSPVWLSRTVVAGLLGGLFVAGFVVMRPFLAAIAWAAILTCVSWPPHLRVLERLRGHRTGAALAMALTLTLTLGVTLIFLGAGPHPLRRSGGLGFDRGVAAVPGRGRRGHRPAVVESAGGELDRQPGAPLDHQRRCPQSLPARDVRRFGRGPRRTSGPKPLDMPQGSSAVQALRSWSLKHPLSALCKPS